ncbi:MAG TPA: YraN family protein [Microbacterium sp.]|nr:YraN family protein [Microbacterium sp.]
MAAKDDLGRAGEDRAAHHLNHSGYRVVDRNWRCPEGELDLVAVRGREVVVVEVKTRRGDGYGDPLEAVDARKQARLWRLAQRWRREHPDHATGRMLRLDVIGITGPDPRSGRLVHLEDIR